MLAGFALVHRSDNQQPTHYYSQNQCQLSQSKTSIFPHQSLQIGLASTPTGAESGSKSCNLKRISIACE